MSDAVLRWIYIVGLLVFFISFGAILAGDHVSDRWSAATMMMVTYLFILELRRQ